MNTTTTTTAGSMATLGTIANPIATTVDNRNAKPVPASDEQIGRYVANWHMAKLARERMTRNGDTVSVKRQGKAAAR